MRESGRRREGKRVGAYEEFEMFMSCMKAKFKQRELRFIKEKWMNPWEWEKFKGRKEFGAESVVEEESTVRSKSGFGLPPPSWMQFQFAGVRWIQEQVREDLRMIQFLQSNEPLILAFGGLNSEG